MQLNLQKDNIIVFGSSGMLGTSLCIRLESKGYGVLRFTRSNLKEQNLEKILIANKVNFAINLVALTYV